LLSIGLELGPHIGVQEGPLIMGKKQAASERAPK
jgi:hypothetical protein